MMEVKVSHMGGSYKMSVPVKAFAMRSLEKDKVGEV